MKMEKFIPSDRLKPYIQHFLIIESDFGMQNLILPSLSVVCSFQIRGSITYVDEGDEKTIPLLGIAGLRSFPREIRYAKEASTILAVFREGGGSGFFKQPMHEIFGLNLPLDHLIDQNKTREIEEKLFEKKTNAERISLIENFLISEIKEQKPDPLVFDTIRKIQFAKGNLKIKEILNGFPVSLDSLEKKFKRIVGTTPKQFSTLVRMRNFIDHYSSDISFTEAAYEAGYFDQAHFIKDFRNFTGRTPKEFFKSATYW
ncbi:AraC family transcriptional regulator [Leptospira ilyithenensis]|uniref:AraC family transcriptional regulator n=2 Tax=Leptospira ilyithenensis TaxID=2484901 RepID=A0A4R9LSJ1_9LEPT|nr:AraC family transcriptional regulator [Leptospira ilyithenensis]